MTTQQSWESRIESAISGVYRHGQRSSTAVDNLPEDECTIQEALGEECPNRREGKNCICPGCYQPQEQKSLCQCKHPNARCTAWDCVNKDKDQPLPEKKPELCWCGHPKERHQTERECYGIGPLCEKHKRPESECRGSDEVKRFFKDCKHCPCKEYSKRNK